MKLFADVKSIRTRESESAETHVDYSVAFLLTPSIFSLLLCGSFMLIIPSVFRHLRQSFGSTSCILLLF